MGTPLFSVLPLRALAEAGHEIAAVYCSSPRPAGRGHKIQKCAVQIAAEEMGFEIRTPKTMRDAEEQKKFADLRLDAAVVVQYNYILPQPVLDAPRLGCINIHPSLLPRWRGAAPMKRAILAGDTETGVTIMRLDAGIDTGPMILQERRALTSTDNVDSLDRDLSAMGTRMLLDALDGLSSGRLHPIAQPEIGAIYASKLTREDGKIDWNVPAEQIERQIRALTPWPGCAFTLQGETVKLLAAAVVPEQSGLPGTLLDNQFTVACGQGALRLLTVQRPGKNPTPGDALLRGLRLPVGSSL
jgi:methionyl-tRNA formyltransferase